MEKKNISLTDIVVGQGNNIRFLKQILSHANVSGEFLDVLEYEGTDAKSFLKESTGSPAPILNLKTLIFYMEALFNGSHTSISSFKEVEAKNGIPAIRPVMNKKELPPTVTDRGLSQESVLFFNEVAVRGIMDAVRIRTRAREAGFPDPTDRYVSDRFVEFIDNQPFGDLRMSIPWQDHAGWVLPDQNALEDSRVKKGDLILREDGTFRRDTTK